MNDIGDLSYNPNTGTTLVFDGKQWVKISDSVSAPSINTASNTPPEWMMRPANPSSIWQGGKQIRGPLGNIEGSLIFHPKDWEALTVKVPTKLDETRKRRDEVCKKIKHTMEVLNALDFDSALEAALVEQRMKCLDEEYRIRHAEPLSNTVLHFLPLGALDDLRKAQNLPDSPNPEAPPVKELTGMTFEEMLERNRIAMRVEERMAMEVKRPDYDELKRMLGLA